MNTPMNTRKRIAIIASIMVVAMLTLMTSTTFALRAAIFFHSPSSAVTMEYREIDSEQGKYLYEITRNAPVEDATEGTLTTWEVRHYGPFKIATYYGEA